MGVRVNHYQTPSNKTHKVVSVFEQYKKKLVPWNNLSDHDILPSKWHHVLTDVPFHTVLDLMLRSVLNDKTLFLK